MSEQKIENSTLQSGNSRVNKLDSSIFVMLIIYLIISLISIFNVELFGPRLFLFIITGFLFLKWFYLLYSKLQNLCEGFTFKLGMGVVVFFIPFFNFFLPYKVVDEAYKASTNLYNWQEEKSSALIMWWWAFCVASVLFEIILLIIFKILDIIFPLIEKLYGKGANIAVNILSWFNHELKEKYENALIVPMQAIYSFYQITGIIDIILAILTIIVIWKFNANMESIKLSKNINEKKRERKEQWDKLLRV